MDYEPLVERQIQEGADYVSSVASTMGLKAAYWLKVPERSDWQLHIALADFDAGDYRKLVSELTKRYRPNLYRSFAVDQLTLDWPNDKVADEVVKLEGKYHWDYPKLMGNRMLGDRYIDAACIYPTSQQFTSKVPQPA